MSLTFPHSVMSLGSLPTSVVPFSSHQLPKLHLPISHRTLLLAPSLPSRAGSKTGLGSGITRRIIGLTFKVESFRPDGWLHIYALLLYPQHLLSGMRTTFLRKLLFNHLRSEHQTFRYCLDCNTQMQEYLNCHSDFSLQE